MTAKTPALPTFERRDAEHDHPGRSRWLGGVLALLAFGFAANALFSTPQASVERSVASVAAPVPAAASDTGNLTGESDEVASAVRTWVWETPGASQAPSRERDVEELWLQR